MKEEKAFLIAKIIGSHTGWKAIDLGFKILETIEKFEKKEFTFSETELVGISRMKKKQEIIERQICMECKKGTLKEIIIFNRRLTKCNKCLFKTPAIKIEVENEKD